MSSYSGACGLELKICYALNALKHDLIQGDAQVVLQGDAQVAF